MGNQKPTICAACAEIAALSGHAEPHKHMRVEGELIFQSDGSCYTSYRCLECDTLFVNRTDKWGTKGGFQLQPARR